MPSLGRLLGIRRAAPTDWLLGGRGGPNAGADTRLAERTIDAGAVDEPEKLWLLGRAGLSSLPDGLRGLRVQFRSRPPSAAFPACGPPCRRCRRYCPPRRRRSFRGTSNRPPSGRWRCCARARLPYAPSPGCVQQPQALTWDATAERLIEIYRRTCDAPASAAGVLERMEPESAVSEDGLRLVGPGGALAPELERPLLALATHPRIGGPVFGAVKAGYRASHFVNRITDRARSRARTAGPPGRP